MYCTQLAQLRVKPSSGSSRGAERARRLEDLGSGWRTVRLQTRRGHDELPREGSVVVMTLGRPPRGDPLGFVRDRCAAAAVGFAAGLLPDLSSDTPSKSCCSAARTLAPLSDGVSAVFHDDAVCTDDMWWCPKLRSEQ